MSFYYGALALVLGLVIGIKINLGSFTLSLLFASVFTSTLLFLVLSKDLRYLSLGVYAIIFLLALGYGKFFISHHIPDQYLLEKVGEKIEFQGIVIAEPIQKEKSTEVIAKTEYGKILLFANSYPHVSYGDQISFKAKLKVPEPFVTDSGRMFDYPGYLSKDDIYFVESYPAITVISHHHGNYIKEKLYNFKNYLIAGMEKMVPFPESALLEGITVAGKRSLPTEIQDEFKRAGVSHIVVLSGYNVTIVALVIMVILSGLPRRISFGAGTLGIIVFCVLAGGTSTIVRAGIMSFLYLLSRFSFRSADPSRLLVLAGCLMILWNPRILFYDASFHLSFLATFGLINLSPFIHGLIGKVSAPVVSFSFLKEIIVSSIAVQFFLLPYLAYSMGNLSLIALLSNILILAFIPITMFFGFVASGLSFVSIHLSTLPSFMAFILLRYELGIAHLMASFPFSIIKTTVSIWFPAVFYFVTLILFLIRQNALERQANSDSQKMLQRISSFPMADSPA